MTLPCPELQPCVRADILAELNMNDARANLVLYDGDCPLCRGQMRVIDRLDWFGALHLLPISDPLTAEMAPELTRDELLEAIHCRAPDGRIYRGARCLRFVGLRLPLLVPVALFLWLPGMIQLADRFYLWGSRRRYGLSRLFGCKEACARTGPVEPGSDK